jgi:LPXTG-site transpeptidase (sortase) family protein
VRRAGFALLVILVVFASAVLTAFPRAESDAAFDVRAAPPEARDRTALPLRAEEPAGQQKGRHLTMLRIPRLGLSERVTWEVNRGPAWWPVTGRPGGGDTIAIAGHRTTHTRPFYYLERLVAGDLVYVTWRGERHVYEVSGQRIYPATHGHIADARGHEVLLLSACTPRGSAEFRLVVYAQPHGDEQNAN